MAIGTILSTVLTLGLTSSVAVYSVLQTLRTVASIVGLGGTLLGVGGGGILDQIHKARFSQSYLETDLESIYTRYHVCLAKQLQIGSVSDKDKMKLFLTARNDYLSENPTIYHNYSIFQKALVNLQGKNPKKLASEKYTNTTKYRRLQVYLRKTDLADLDFQEDHVDTKNSRSFYRLLFKRDPKSRKNSWEALVMAIFDDPRYRDCFHEKLVQELEYSRLSEKEAFFSKIKITKNRKGLSSPLTSRVFGRKTKHLRVIDSHRLGQELQKKDLGLTLIVHRALVKLIKEIKTAGKRRIRGVEYGIFKSFVSQL